MKVDAIVCEIGSTTTIVNAFSGFDKEDPKYLGQAFAPTSIVEGDVSIGVMQALNKLKDKLNTKSLEYKEMFATSSAAGGLKMTVHGLVYEMTAKAAYEAAMGAGGNIKMITSGDIRHSDIEKLKNLKPNIILVAGGVDYGERETALNNIQKIIELELDIPIIYAGNVENHEEIKLVNKQKNIEDLVIFTENVYPKIDCLNIEPTRKIIHNTFEKHITKAEGMKKIKSLVTENIVPTPGAVMEAAKLLYNELGDLLCYDIGGATTDIHSITAGSEEISEIMISPEPLAKRTVEGDLGVYVNRENVLNQTSSEEIANKLNMTVNQLVELLQKLKPIPSTEEEINLVESLAKTCLKISLDRHAGEYRNLYTTYGKKQQAEGKDLTAVKYIIATGGVLTKLNNSTEIIKENHMINKNNKLYPPKGSKILIDRDYIMASCGVLSKKYPEIALKLLKKSLFI